MLKRLLHESYPSTARIALCGEFDIFRREELAAALSQADDASVVVLDLTETTFVDATTLSSFLQLRKRARKAGAVAVHVVGARPHIRKLLAITGLDKVLEVHEHATATLAVDVLVKA